MTDQIFLQGLIIPARIGVLAHEKQAAQDVTVDIVLDVDTQKAAITDDLHDTIDYAKLAEQLAAHCLQQHVELVERLAQQLADICLSDERVQKVTLSLSKPHALTNASGVGVLINRSRSS